jgi:UDP-glucose 4-epimerase
MALQGQVGDFAIFGNDYPTPDGTAIRDYIHVSDLAAAHVMGAGLLASGQSGGTYNLGTGAGYSVKDVLSAIFRETGLTMPLIHRPRRAGDPPMLIADPSAARRDLGFKPVHSSLDTIIATAWRWHRNIANTARAGGGSVSHLSS